MAIAFLSLLALLLAGYLHLYKVGMVGGLACTSGGCDAVMFSRWGSFLGLDVSLIGAIGYGLILLTSLASMQPRWQSARWPVVTLLILSVGGFLFTLRLKYGEFVVLRTFCQWCAISAAIITVILLLAVIEWRRAGR
jgi:uncharacterized membrane protein